ASANLDSWLLEQAPLGYGSFTPLASGNNPVADYSSLARLDPSLLANGLYRLRLTAVDISGRSSPTEVIVAGLTDKKTTQVQQTVTDLSVTLGGVPLNLSRAYDSLNRDRTGTFGFGWRLANRDTYVQTNVPLTGRENLGAYNPFRVGTRVYVTLPDGRRVGFT